jgi:hypothetical protein
VNLNAAIMECYGCKLPEIPGDGKMYTFPIGQLKLGYVINFGDISVFGCRSDGDNYYFRGDYWQGYNSMPARPAKQELNRMIIECARGLIARGEVLCAADSVRLKLAVQQVEANS